MEKNFEENTKKLCNLISPTMFKFNMGLENITITCDYTDNPEIIYLPSRINVVELSNSDFDYLNSNRHKLYQAIKKSNISASRLSYDIGKNINYLSATASKSRFNSRGDISETQLNRLITDIAFAEREVLGFGAKDVEDVENKSFKGERLTSNDFKEAKRLILANPDKIKNPLFKDGGFTDIGEQTRKKIKLAQEPVNLKKGSELKPKTITFLRYYLYIALFLLFIAISLSIYTLTKLV